MKQEVEIVLTLEVDIEKSQQDIIDFIYYKLDNKNHNANWIDLFEIKTIKEEAELYQTE